MTTYHCSIDISGMLSKPNKREWKRFEKFATYDGKKLSGEQWKELFRRRYNDGDRFFPMSQCDNFDPLRGCKGHEENPS